MKTILFLAVIFLNFTHLFAQTNINLSLNVKEGDTFISDYKLTSSSLQNVNGEEQIVKKETNYSILFNVLQPKSDTSYYIKLRLKKIRYIIDIQGNTRTFDSDSINKDYIAKQDSFLLNVNNGYNFEISKKNKIISIDSINLLTFGDTKTSLLKGIKSVRFLNLFFPKFPSEKIGINKKWIIADTTKHDIYNITNKTNTLSNTYENNITINSKSKIFSDKNKAHEANSYFIFYNLNGNRKSDIKLLKKTLFAKEVNISENINGTAEIKYSKDGGAIYSWPLTIKNIISINTHKISDK